MADAEDLPYEDGRFDCAGSVFGAMFAPRPDRVAAELFRVVRAGRHRRDGELGARRPLRRDAQGPAQARAAGAGGLPDPADWGNEEIVRERFEGLAARIEAEPRVVPFRWASPEEAWDWLDRNAPTQQADSEALSEEEYEQYREAVLDMFRKHTDESGAVVFDSPYLLVVARKRG